jgi:hypothetical protein
VSCRCLSYLLGISRFRASTVAIARRAHRLNPPKQSSLRPLRLLHSADAFAKGCAFERSTGHETQCVKTNQPFRGCEETPNYLILRKYSANLNAPNKKSAGLTNMRQIL